MSAPLASPVAGASTPTGSLNKLQHIVVIYQENWSFDSLFPDFPGANGIKNATTPQVDKNGKPYSALPQSLNRNLTPVASDSRFPANLANAPFNGATYVPVDKRTGDLQQYVIVGLFALALVIGGGVTYRRRRRKNS